MFAMTPWWLSGCVRQGPAPERHKVVRWRLIDLRDEIAREFGVLMHERTVDKRMAHLHFARVSAPPRHPGQDAAAQEAHKTYGPRCPQAISAT